MSTISAVLLIPLEVTPSMIVTGTNIPEVDTSAGEVAWDDQKAGGYDADEEVCHVGWIWASTADANETEPGTDATKWTRMRPSNRMAAFDPELNTITRRTGEIKYVVRPGFFTGLGLWGLVGAHLNVKIYDEPDGEIVEEYDGDLWDQAQGLYELLFMPLANRTQHLMQNLPLYPDAEVHITISAGSGAPVQVALITIGHWDTLVGSGEWGGVEYEAEVDVKTYSYLKRNDDGTVTRLRRGAADNGRYPIIIPASEANHAKSLLHKVQGRPVAIIASGMPMYEYLNGFGDVSGVITASGPNHARINLRIEGAVQGVQN